MSLKVAIFEDDRDVADLLTEMLQTKDFQVSCHYNLNDDWQSCDVILADYRNKIVSFKSIQSESHKKNIPLIAISGAETQYSPQLLKPFSLESLQAVILDTLNANKKSSSVSADAASNSSFVSFFKKSG